MKSLSEASQEYGVARQKKIDDMTPEEFAKAAAEDKAKREELMKKTQKEGTEMSFTRPSAGVTEDMLDLVRAYEGTPPADPIQTVATNEHVTMSDRLAGWYPAHLVSEDVEQLDEKQFGAPANKDKFKIKSETAASTVNSLMKKKLGNKEIKTALKAEKTVKEEVELGETLQEITKARVIAAIRKGIDKEKDAWKSGDMTSAVKMGKKVVSVASKAKSHFKEETEE